jgi:uncharacterized repeat protein (TIGR03803 family)
MKTYIKNLFLLSALIAGLGLIPAGRVTAQTFTTLHSFTGGNEGAHPSVGLVLSGATLYGTAYLNDGSAYYGTVFKVNTNGTGFTTLHVFTPPTASSPYTNSDGANPHASLILSGNTLYGTAYQGGSSGFGTVFAVNTDGTGFTTLHSFTYGSDGAFPQAGLVLSGNTLYGTAEAGGTSSGSGTVFAVNTDGTGFTTLHSFTNSSGGWILRSGLVLSGNALYGTTVSGGDANYGTVFALNTDGTGFTTLHSFTGGDGYSPQTQLVLSGNTLYGTASGGAFYYSTMFAVNTDGTGFTTLHDFNGSEGGTWAGLIVSGNTLYGTTYQGGSSFGGMVFAVSTAGTGFTKLHNFTAPSGSPGTNSDGAYLGAGLILSGNTLYGTAEAGGSSGNGTVFALNTALTRVGPLGYSTGGTPARSSNPWQFTVAYSNLVSGLTLTVQSTLPPNDPGSWATLAPMTQSNWNWSANPAFVPTGDRYFRVVASAPGWVDNVSDLVGPITVLGDIAPFGFFSWQTTGPERNGALWTFTITEPSLISDLRLVVQSSPDNLSSWSDLPGGSQMTNSSGNWTLDTTNLPLGQQFFRVVAYASTYLDRNSKSLGPFNIEAALTTVTKTTSGSGYHTLSLDDVPEMQDPDIVYEEAVIKAALQLAFTLNFKQFNAALTLAAEQYASVKLLVGKNQTLKIPAVNAGPNASVELQGTINGDVALIGNAGGALIGNAGGALTGNAGTQAAVVSNDGGSLISQDGGGLISQDGGGLISQDGGGLISQDGGGLTGKAGAAVSVAGKTPLTPRPKSPTPTQPTFTGQMTINGNYSQFPGTALIIGIAGTNTLAQGAQQFDQLVVSGQANLLGGTIAFGLFDPDDQTNLANVFQPPDGATFDVVVASNIVVHALHLLGPVWGDGLFFKGGVVTRDDGLQVLRLMAIHIPPRIFLQNAGSALQLIYATNYTGYTVESSTNLSNWSAFSTGTNVVPLSLTNSSQFFRMSKP